MKCPQCATDLKSELLIIKCKCGFSISMKRFDEIIDSLYKKSFKSVRVPNEMENLEALNNLGHEEETDGFLDDEEIEDEIYI
jgi:hypothetical protein